MVDKRRHSPTMIKNPLMIDSRWNDVQQRLPETPRDPSSMKNGSWNFVPHRHSQQHQSTTQSEGHRQSGPNQDVRLEVPGGAQCGCTNFHQISTPQKRDCAEMRETWREIMGNRKTWKTWKTSSCGGLGFEALQDMGNGQENRRAPKGLKEALGLCQAAGTI